MKPIFCAEHGVKMELLPVPQDGEVVQLMCPYCGIPVDLPRGSV